MIKSASIVPCPLPLSPRPAGSSRNTPDVDEVPEPAEEIEVLPTLGKEELALIVDNQGTIAVAVPCNTFSLFPSQHTSMVSPLSLTTHL